MAVHFVYAGFPDDGRLQAPYSITRNLYHRLKAEFGDVIYHEWLSETDIVNGPNDVLLGHPAYNPNSVVQKAFRSGRPWKAKCVIHPLHTRRVEDNMPFDHLARAADHIFAITGEYWYDTIDSTPFAHWKPKMTRVDMAVDAHHFPYVRTAFRPVGKRRLAYIGSSMPQKNLAFLVKVMKELRDVELDWYGGSGDHPLAKLPNVRTFGWMVLDSTVAARIATECDIFINVSLSDANATTILETAAWGLVPILSKESGYWPNRSNGLIAAEVNIDDLGATLANVRRLLETPTVELERRARHNRAVVESHYTWGRFCGTIMDGLRGFV
jgi:glycosyltransferase involved in cell wall biosynthesis